MRHASSFRRQPPRDRTTQHHQRERSRQYPYPTPNQSPSAQNAFQAPARSSMVAQASPAVAHNRLPALQPEPNVSWHRSSSPPLRKLGDTTFRYRDLDPSRNEIRLLRIFPATTDNVSIECEVLHTSLDDPRSYIAVSYMWGDAGDTRIITLDGHEFPVTLRLWQFLQRLRSQTFAVIVWADAVCINQHVTEERNLQVQMMTRIYSLAYEVAVWLGPEADDSNLAMDLLHEISMCSGPQVDFSRLKDIIHAKTWRTHFRALVELFERDYWTRLWIVQEIVNAREVSVHCGSRTLPWDAFATSIQLFRSHRPDLIKSFPGTAEPGEACLSRNSRPWPSVLASMGPAGIWNGKVKLGFLQALIHTRLKSCTDPRDKVYGILGVLPDQEPFQFLVEYNLPKRELYVNIVEYILTTTGKLDVLCHAINFPLRESEERLPSWVPDWAHKPDQKAIGHAFPRFRASQTTDARFAFVERSTKLEIAGLRIDTIVTCGSPISPPNAIHNLIMTVFQWRLLLLAYDSSSHDNATAQESFCHALCLGHLPLGVTPRQWMEQIYYILATFLKAYYPALVLDDQLTAFANVQNPLSTEDQNAILHDLVTHLTGRNFFISDLGLICLGSGAALPGDIICVPLGCSTPIILRARKEGYQYIGDIYVDGYMYGKAIDELDSGKWKLETFRLQ